MDINSLSPSIREALLARNIVSDSVSDNGLSGLLYSIGTFSSVANIPQSVQASPNLEEIGDLYQDLLIINNKYQGTLDERTRISIVDTNNNIDSTTNNYSITEASLLGNSQLQADLNIIRNKYQNTLGVNQVIDIKTYQPLDSNLVPQPYEQDNASLADNDEYRKNITTKSKFLDFDAQILRDIITTPVVTDKNFSNYLDETAGIVGGSVAVGASSVIDNILGGVIPNSRIGSPNPVFDIRGILASQNLDNSNETPLGLIGANQLAFAIQANSGANLYEETIGNINTNPLSVMMGNDIIVPNYSITVAKGDGGTILNYAEKILGFESPISLYANSSSIFQSENPVPNVQRGNSQIANTGRGQVLSLFANLRASLLNSNATKSGYAPGFVDEKDPDGGINPNIYAFSDNEGGVIDLLHGDDNNPISQSNYQLEGMVKNSGFRGLEDLKSSLDSNPQGSGVPFAWNDPKVGITTPNANFAKKSILSKTQALFDNSSKMVNLMTTKYANQLKSEVNSAVVDTGGASYISKGSAVRKFNGREPETNPQNMFARAWTTFDRYDSVENLQKNSGLNTDAGVNQRGSVVGSVLDDNGFVRIAPNEGDDSDYNSVGTDNKIRNFMFSIENLAWADDTDKLIPSEIGPGDIMSAKRGRIMWFPPYEMNFVDNTNVDWEKTNFIGRGEPVYTYNNTERTGNLQFKIIIDHPAYLNSLKGESNALIDSFFAGEFEIDGRVRSKLSLDEENKIEVERNQLIDDVNNTPQTPPSSFSVYFPFNEGEFNDAIGGYEDDLNSFNQPINRNIDPTGLNLGLGTYAADNGVSYNDSTNYGLNGDVTPASFTTNLQNALRNQCPACKVSITSYYNPNEVPSVTASRLVTTESWFTDTIFDANDPIKNKRVTVTDGGALGANAPTGNEDARTYKDSRKAIIKFEWDAKLAEELNPNKKTQVNNNPATVLSNAVKARFYNEIGFFKKLEQEDKFVYDSISEKIRYFHPSFHSITPEGFNSRLTFLQQCTRQGPTHSGDGDGLCNPNNLAFGRPPVCILRIGDFYHTKVVIDTVNFSYEPLVWDLNPEGVGVQPMICTVDLNFAMIGGSSLQGPINRLQNAVSFNFFANTEIYDHRADKIRLGENSGELVEGDFPTTFVTDNRPADAVEGLSNNTTAPDTNQTATADGNTGSGTGGASTPPVAVSSAQTDFERLTIFGAEWSGLDLTFTIFKDGDEPLSDNYDLQVITTGAGPHRTPSTSNPIPLDINADNKTYTVTYNDWIDADSLFQFPKYRKDLKVKLMGTSYALNANITGCEGC